MFFGMHQTRNPAVPVYTPTNNNNSYILPFICCDITFEKQAFPFPFFITSSQNRCHGLRSGERVGQKVGPPLGQKLGNIHRVAHNVIEMPGYAILLENC